MAEIAPTPHGWNVPCNYYCQETHHAIVVLGECLCGDGKPSDAASIIAGCTPYYADMGWQVVSARRIEADRETILRALWDYNPTQGPVRIEPFDIAEHALPHSTEGYEPWMLTVIPCHGKRG